MSLLSKTCFTALAIAALALTAAPRLARADAQQQQSFSIWNQMGDCARIAARQYPDARRERQARSLSAELPAPAPFAGNRATPGQQRRAAIVFR